MKIKTEPGTEIVSLESPFEAKTNTYAPANGNRFAAGPIEVSDSEKEAIGTG